MNTVIVGLLLQVGISLVVNPLEHIEGANLVRIAAQISGLQMPPSNVMRLQSRVHSKCPVCDKQFKNSTYLDLHLVTFHMDFGNQYIQYDRVCMFSRCLSSRYARPIFANQLKMQMCLTWTLKYHKEKVVTMELARKMDLFCRELIVNGDTNAKHQTLAIFTPLLKGILLLIVSVCVWAFISQMISSKKVQAKNE